MIHLTLLTILLFVLQVQALKIPLPPGVQPEGVTHAAGSNYLTADLRSAAIYLVDVKTGLTTTAVPPTPGRLSIGLFARKNLIFVAGGGALTIGEDSSAGAFPAVLYVYDLVTGKTLAECKIPNGGFVNDVTADDKFAYYTDSFRRFVYRLSLKDVSRCQVKRIPLPKPAFKNEDGVFRGNGIRLYRGGLIVANSEEATLYFIDLKRPGRTHAIFPPGTLMSPDGLEIVHRKRKSLLYVAQNIQNKVSEWKLRMDDNRRVSASLVRNITSKDFEVPTTVAVNDGTLVAANSRFDEFGPLDEIGPDDLFSLAVLRI